MCFYPGPTDFVKIYVRARKAVKETQNELLHGKIIKKDHRHFPFTKMPKPEKITEDNNLSPWHDVVWEVRSGE